MLIIFFKKAGGHCKGRQVPKFFDKIHFDFGATDYHLDKLRLATGVIPTDTVEIPAIPEDFQLLKRKMV